MSVAAAIEPDDLSICDIGREAKVQSPKAKAQSAPHCTFVLVVVLVLVIESGSKNEDQPSRRRFGAAGEDEKEDEKDMG
jgi:hypothetical protein